MKQQINEIRRMQQLAGIISENQEPLGEAQLDPVNQQLKDKYIDDYLTQTIDDYASEYDSDLTDMDTIEAHAKEFGYTNTLRTIDAKNDSKFSDRGIPHGGFDPLQGKVPGNYMRDLSTYRREPVITKKGKMHKYDVDLLKRKIKLDLGL
jgi:hypothetical protein